MSVEDRSVENGQQSKNTSECDEKQQLFLRRLEEAVANGGTKNLWRQYGNRITMQFKERNLEAKVRGENATHLCSTAVYLHVLALYNMYITPRSLFRSHLNKLTTSVWLFSVSSCSSTSPRPSSCLSEGSLSTSVLPFAPR